MRDGLKVAKLQGVGPPHVRQTPDEGFFAEAWTVPKYRTKTVPSYDARVPFLPHHKGAERKSGEGELG